jgi:uncharacterized protein (UPF0333 family)
MRASSASRNGFLQLLRRRDGQLTLPFVLLIGGIIVEVAIAGAFVTYFLSNSGYGERLSIRAGAAAESGVRDAMVKITQNKEFLSNGGEATYSVSVSTENTDNALVTVTRSDSGTKYLYVVTSLGTAVSRQKKYVARIYVDAVTGQTELESVKEVAVE